LNILLSIPLQDTLWYEIARNLIKIEKYNFFISSHNKPKNLKFRNNFIDLCELNNFENKSIFDNLDINLSNIYTNNQYLKLKGIYSSAASRCGYFRSNAINQEYLFNILVSRITTLVLNNNIKIIGFDLTPHLPWELLAWEIIRIFGGYSFCFKRTIIGGAIYMETEIFGDKSNPFIVTSQKHPIYYLKDIYAIEDHLKKNQFSKFQKKGQWIDNNKEISFKDKLKLFMNKNIWIKYLSFLVIGIKFNKNMKVKPYLKANEETRDISYIVSKSFHNKFESLFFILKYITTSLTSELSLKKLIFNNQTDVELALNEKYIFFPLNMQPESTTIPQAIFWCNIISSINLIRSKFKDIPILVKEHPRQYQFDIRKFGFRTSEFYKIISKVKNVYFIDTNLSSQTLTNNAYAVAGINGTNLYESLMLGKPTLYFTKQLIFDVPHSININNSSAEEIKNKIDLINRWDKTYKRNLCYESLKSQSKYLIHSGLYWRYINLFFKGDFNLTSKNIISAILDFCKEKDL